MEKQEIKEKTRKSGNSVVNTTRLIKKQPSVLQLRVNSFDWSWKTSWWKKTIVVLSSLAYVVWFIDRKRFAAFADILH